MDYAIHVRKWSSLWEIVKKKKVWCKEAWLSEWVYIHCYGEMHVTWIKAPQWCAWQTNKQTKTTAKLQFISVDEKSHN